MLKKMYEKLLHCVKYVCYRRRFFSVSRSIPCQIDRVSLFLFFSSDPSVMSIFGPGSIISFLNIEVIVIFFQNADDVIL